MLQPTNAINTIGGQPNDQLVGLSLSRAAQRLDSEGFNELPSVKKRSFPSIAFGVLKQPMFALLIGGGVIYFFLGDRLEGFFLLMFACLSVVITIVQESRSEKVLESLRDLASPRARVIRDGIRLQIAGREVVREDVIIFSEGDRVAADAILVSSVDLLVDESLLTGESVPVRKLVKKTDQPDANQKKIPGGEDLPYLYAGTLVVRGSGIALVHATGLHSEMGKIGHALQSIKTEQPHLTKQLHGLVRNFAIVGAIAGVSAVLLFGLLRGSWLQAMLSGIALGMSLLPEEFPLVLAVFMAMGSWRISQARVLTRRASSIESLGAVTVLCTDKTGTLTENKMTVVAINSATQNWEKTQDFKLDEDIKIVLKTVLLACPQQPTDPMDIAIHQLAKAQIGPNETSFAQYTLVHAYGFRPDMFAVANVLTDLQSGVTTVYAKGALETISELCQLTPVESDHINEQAQALAKKGIRVLGIAKASLSLEQLNPLPTSLGEFNFDYVGLIGFADPLRETVPDAVAQCQAAGIKVVMITGDYPETARAIGQQAGLDTSHVLDGKLIDSMSDQALADALKNTSIFARIRPNQKLRLVKGFKAQGEVVAMTGDGVNDAPAIKAADVGIAMGGRGTDVAREASSIVLLDDDFGSIVKTIKLGRRVYDNLRKAIEYIIAVHIPIAGLAILPLVLGLPLILTPIHIAFLELVIDPACSIVFEAERAENNIMLRPPRNPKSPLVLKKRVIWAILQGLLVLVVLAVVLISATNQRLPESDIRTLVFTVLVTLNMGLILINRSFTTSLIKAVMEPNRSLWLLLTAISILLAVAVFWSPARLLFQFGQFQWQLFLFSFVASVLTLLILEAIKKQWFSVKDESFQLKTQRPT
jgi:P-type Ca2+ transporter type 2C